MATLISLNQKVTQVTPGTGEGFIITETTSPSQVLLRTLVVQSGHTAQVKLFLYDQEPVTLTVEDCLAERDEPSHARIVLSNRPTIYTVENGQERPLFVPSFLDSIGMILHSIDLASLAGLALVESEPLRTCFNLARQNLRAPVNSVP